MKIEKVVDEKKMKKGDIYAAKFNIDDSFIMFLFLEEGLVGLQIDRFGQCDLALGSAGALSKSFFDFHSHFFFECDWLDGESE